MADPGPDAPPTSDAGGQLDDAALRGLLEGATTIAVVGASTDPDKAAHRIPALLLDAGYTVVPVHPTATEVLGQRAHPTLADVPVPIDVVDVFRPPRATPAIAEQAVAVGAGALWLQLGIASPEARATAEAGGLTYVEDLCIGRVVQRLGTHPNGGRGGGQG